VSYNLLFPLLLNSKWIKPITCLHSCLTLDTKIWRLGNFLGKEATRVVVFEYDKKIVIPLFKKSNKFLNLFGGNNNS